MAGSSIAGVAAASCGNDLTNAARTYIVPISAILQKPDLRPLSYDGALELFSRPLMQQYRGNWSFGPEQLGDDGVTYNLQFDRYQDALHVWRYPDLTRHVTFLAAALDLTIEQEMRAEAQYLQRHGAARADRPADAPSGRPVRRPEVAAHLPEPWLSAC